MSASDNLNGLDAAEAEIVLREAREGNASAQAWLAKPLLAAPAAAPVIETKDQRRKRLTHEHHLRIVAGEVDLGPKPDTHVPSVDTRDRRDPAALGAQVLDKGQKYGSIINAADYLDSPSGRMETPSYDPGESRATFTARAYRQELEQRALEGDKFAISVLTTGQPGDSGE